MIVMKMQKKIINVYDLGLYIDNIIYIIIYIILIKNKKN